MRIGRCSVRRPQAEQVAAAKLTVDVVTDQSQTSRQRCADTRWVATVDTYHALSHVSISARRPSRCPGAATILVLRGNFGCPGERIVAVTAVLVRAATDPTGRRRAQSE